MNTITIIQKRPNWLPVSLEVETETVEELIGEGYRLKIMEKARGDKHELLMLYDGNGLNDDRPANCIVQNELYYGNLYFVGRTSEGLTDVPVGIRTLREKYGILR